MIDHSSSNSKAFVTVAWSFYVEYREQRFDKQFKCDTQQRPDDNESDDNECSMREDQRIV